MKKILLSAAMILAITTMSNAGVISDFGLDPSTGFNRTPGTGAFSDQYTFTLNQAMTLTIASLTNTFASSSQFISGFTVSIVSDPDLVIGNGDDFTVIGPTMATLGCPGVPVGCQGMAGSAFLNAGNYYVDISGNDAGPTASYGGDITTFAVPGPAVGSGIPGLLAGLMMLGLLAYRRCVS